MKPLNFILLTSALLAGWIGVASATPVRFTTNEVSNDVEVAINGPYRVSYISVYVDNVLKCYTESNGVCTATPNLTPGLHTARYVWANCNNPNTCPHYGEVTHYVNVPDQVARFDVRIPTVRVRWYTPGGSPRNGTKVSLNGVFRGDALYTSFTGNVLSGCYTASYFSPYAAPIPAWPALPGVPDGYLKGFDRVCFGSINTYPTPTPDSGSDTSPPHVRITVPANLWP